MNKYKKLLSNAGVFTIANFGSRILSFIFVPVYTYWLTTRQYGIIDTFSVTVSLLTPLLTLCLQDAAMRFAMDTEKDDSECLSGAMYVMAINSIIAILIAFILSFIKADISSYIWWITFNILLQGINAVLAQFLRGIGKIKSFALTGVLVTVSQICFNILFIKILNKGVEGYFISYLFSNTICICFCLIRIPIVKYLSIKKIKFAVVKEMLRFSIPLVPTAVMWWIMNSLDKYFIISILGMSVAGIYAISVKIPNIITTLYVIFQQAWQITSIEEYGNKEYETFYKQIYSVLFQMLLLCCSIIICFCKILIKIFMEASYFESWKYIPFLLIGAVYSGMAGFLGTNYVTAKRTKGALRTSGITAACNLILNLLLTPVFGMFGTSFATMVSFILLWFIRVKDTKRLINIKLGYKKEIFVTLIIILQIGILYTNFKYQVLINLLLIGIQFFLNRKYIIKFFKQVLKRIGNGVLYK